MPVDTHLQSTPSAISFDREEKGIEYEFTLPDGTKRYEICFSTRDAVAFQKMHRATSFAPLNQRDKS